MKTLKILFTSVGRRVELMQAFRSAAERMGVKLVIYGADLTTTAPALLFCDKTLQTCRIREEGYIPQLIAFCAQEHIDALIPTIDTDLLLLSQNKQAFLSVGTRVIVSDEDKVKLCRDKRFTAEYFHSVGLLSPDPVDDYTKYTGGFPAFIKPKDGSSSIFAYKVENEEELISYAAQVPDYIVQPFIEGTEYTVDIFCDFDGQPIYVTPRERVAVRAGEVLKTTIRCDEIMTNEMLQLVKDYKPCGGITVQLIRQKGTDKNYYIEINPRFGGGAPLSIRAGADSATALIKLLLGENIGYQPNAAANGATFSRFDQCVCTGVNDGEIKGAVFDLDDTLYPEKAYVYSGLRAVAAAFPQMQGVYETLVLAFEKGLPIFDTAAQSLGLDKQTTDKFLEIYRAHMPDIRLYDGAKTLLERLRAKGIKTGIITDGRPEGQRNKIKALGLEKLVDEIIVTDELGGAIFRKPNDISFRIMQGRMGLAYGEMVYIGDNLSKDFVAPRQLGMQAIYVKNPDGLYVDACACAPEGVRTVNSLLDIEI